MRIFRIIMTNRARLSDETIVVAMATAVAVGTTGRLLLSLV